jgi:hypothetical protein
VLVGSLTIPSHRQVLRHSGGPRDAILGSDNGKYFLRAHRTIHSRRTYFATVKKIDVHTFIAHSAFQLHYFLQSESKGVRRRKKVPCNDMKRGRGTPHSGRERPERERTMCRCSAVTA